MRPTHFIVVSATLGLLLCSTSHAADSSRPPDTAVQRCQPEPQDAALPEHKPCDPHGLHPADEPGHMPPPPHEPPLAAVKACMGRKIGSKTTIYLHGDSIPAICQPYDGMVLARPLHPLLPPPPPDEGSHAPQ
ncbi:hypothetical protein [Aquitalea magnusonii]|uniref:Secreted protein n=1 Tax=Aquitalea magnusonii TaxID=332411 RepID=A0A318JQS1_9NEIS|nr:hypothetical protein [Aquitalea magnusonii]PXX50598.1 hypothetical protein DFR38_102255 [Aquitalea magnusonii]